MKARNQKRLLAEINQRLRAASVHAPKDFAPIPRRAPLAELNTEPACRIEASKRYVVLSSSDGGYGWSLHAECDTIGEAVIQRELCVGFCKPIIAEIIKPLDAYMMAHREMETAKLHAAYGKPRA